jgi:hypothetical protein
MIPDIMDTIRIIQKKIIIPASFFLLILPFCSIVNAAESNIHFGVLEIYPFISVEETYNDNIYRKSGDDLKNDWITRSTAGLGLVFPLIPVRKKDFLVSLDYKTILINYLDYKDENRIDHSASAQIDLNFTNNVFIRVADDYEKTADPATSELTEPEKRFRNNAALVISRKKKKFGFEFGYRNIRDGYETRNNLDKFENVLNANLYYEIFPKTAVSVEYRSGKINYDQNTTNSDSDYQEAGLALKGRLAPKTIGIIKGGYRITDYEEESKDDFTGFTVFGNITYNLKKRFVLNMYGERQPHESTFLTNSYYISNKGGLKIDIRFVYNLYFAADGFYQINNYPLDNVAGVDIEKRKDQLYGGGGSLRYELQDMIIMKLKYDYISRNSNFDFFDYKNNQYSASILLKF